MIFRKISSAVFTELSPEYIGINNRKSVLEIIFCYLDFIYNLSPISGTNTGKI